LLFVADEPKRADATPISESERSAIAFQSPARGFVFDGAVIMLALGVALLAGFVVLAVLLEARNGKPGTISGNLTRLGIETSGKGILVGELGTVALQIILGDTVAIHPLSQAFVPDELDQANGLLNSCHLSLVCFDLVFVDQHALVP
jgi:hypothetical protein